MGIELGIARDPKTKIANITTKTAFPAKIQLSGITQIEQELNKKQQEFTSAMAVPVPTTPVFTDNTKDKPLTEMNMIIQRTIAERNLQLDKLRNTSLESLYKEFF
jgi:hypothetical protein